MYKENAKKLIRSDALILLAILVLAAIFRFYKLRTVPDWFQDEGEFIRLADYLSKGTFDFLGIRNSLLLIGRPPLFLWILAGLFKLFSTDIIVLRSLTVMCSILTIGISYILARQALGRTVAFYAAFLLAIFPEYIFYNRIGFSYNWTSLWILIFIFALWKYLTLDNQRWLVIACLAAGIAFASDYVGIICVLVLFLVITFTHPKQLWKMVIVGIPWLVAMLPIFIIAPADAWHDLIFTIFWGAGGKSDLIVKFSEMISKYAETVKRQTLIVLGIIGIFTLKNIKLRVVILMMIGGIFILLLPSRVLLAHYLLPVWPLIMIGLGSFLEISIAYIYTFIQSSLNNLGNINGMPVNNRLKNALGSIGSTLVVFVIIFLPISWMIILSVRSFMIEPAIPTLALQENPFSDGFIPAGDAQAVAERISPTLNPEDFVIAPGVISWMLPSNAADARTVVVYDYGGRTLGMGNVDKDRFTVNSSLSNAKYAIVDNTWRVWMENMAPEIATMLNEVIKWPLFMSQGDLKVYCNPVYCR
jgi:4-amino-4-deoxy-L-arabinose transferase-like glycosyltransferase